MRCLVAVLAVAAVVAFAAPDLSSLLDFLPGKNLTSAEDKFTYRYSHADSIDLPGGSDVLGWISASVDASSASSEAKASANAMIGVGALPTFLYPPFAMLAYGVGSGAVDTNVISFLTMMLARGQLDANFQSGAVGLVALNMQEYDRDGNAVGDAIPLKAAREHPCTSSKINGDDGNLTGLSCTFNPAGSSATVTLTYVTSKKAGIMKYANAPVSPRSLEMIIEVSDFPLSSSQNHVRLNFGLLTASGAGSVKGTANVVRRPFVDDIYSATSKYGVVDDQHVELEVNLELGSAELEATADAVIKAALGADFDAQIAHVDFPAGAKSFIYDPAVGAGVNVYEANGESGASSSSASASASSSVSPAGNGSSSSGKASSASASSGKASSATSSSNGVSTTTLSLFVALVSLLIYVF